MRHVARHLPAYLALLIPLAAMAWFGSLELGRLTERAEKALADHALAFLRDASRTLEGELARSTAAAAAPLDIEFQSLVRVDQQLTAEDPRVLGIVAIDGEGNLVHPTTVPTGGPDLPFHRADAEADIRAAEHLIALEDADGARELLQRYLERGGRRGPWAARSRRRAEFRLATVLRQSGELAAAEEHYVAASRLSTGTRESAALDLMCDVALAEVDQQRSGDHGRLLEVMQWIAHGERYQSVGDDLLAETVLYLRDQIPAEAAEAPAAIAAVATDAVRRAGREFSREYGSFLRETVRRQLRSVGEREVLYACDGGDQPASLLVLRRIDTVEREQALHALDGAEWIGLRFDLEALLRAAVDPLLDPTSPEFYLAIESPDGTPILPREAPPADADRGALPRQRSFAGLMLRAEPANPAAYVSERRDSALHRALFIVALCVAAGGGALLLVRSVARESELATLKLELVSRVSHELKTPLALIRMYAETIALGRSGSAEQTERFTGIIVREADRLTAMIQRVLDFARPAAQRDAERTRADLGAITAAVAAAFGPQAAAHGIAVRTDAEPGLVADVDTPAFESTVLNLIDNAVKYTRAARATSPVDVSIRRHGANAVLEVQDRGIGIPDDEREAVFTAFHRARNAGEAPGAGLGLSLVHRFVAAHGGTVEALAREGGGTVLRLRLPLAAPSLTSSPTDPSPSEPSSTEKGTEPNGP